ncbi:MAG: glycosyltransferase family 39 protein [Lachnospiraceae bacterium]|nr:glycosyltransferase family 39 protein [Lachnospiraceae bacterium]
MIEKMRTSCRVFLQGFLGLFIAVQCVLGILYWFCNVTRAQKFDTVSVLGKFVAGLPVLPVHLIQTGLVYAAAYFFFRRLWERRQSLVCALAAVTCPFVMQVCLCETEHAAALTAILCMTAVIADCHIHKEQKLSRFQTVLFGVCLVTLVFCGAAYSCAAALICLVCMVIEEKKHHRKKKTHMLCLLASLIACVMVAWFGIHLQNEANPDRMQITFESVLFKRFAYPGLEGALSEGVPEELFQTFDTGQINNYRIYPYLLDTEFESFLLETVGAQRAQEIYLELAWHGLDRGIKVDCRMILEDMASYLFPQLMFPLYADGTILAEFGWGFQQFVAHTPYLAEIYMYGSLLGYAVGLVLTIICLLVGGIQSARESVKGSWPFIVIWFGLAVIFTMRGAAIFNYKYAAYQAILIYLPLLTFLGQTKDRKIS